METNKESQHEEQNKLIVSYLTEQDLKRKYAAELAQKYNIHREAPSPKIKHFSWIKYAAVAIIFLASFIVTNFFLSDITPQQMAVEHIRNTHILGDPSSMRKDNVSIEQLRIDANYAFANQNFDESIRLFQQIVNSEFYENSDYFYLGVSHLKGSNPQPKKALDALQKVASNSSLEAETKWFTALAYLLDNDPKAAKGLLKDIIKVKGYKYREAKELVEKI